MDDQHRLARRSVPDPYLLLVAACRDPLVVRRILRRVDPPFVSDQLALQLDRHRVPHQHVAAPTGGHDVPTVVRVLHVEGVVGVSFQLRQQLSVLDSIDVDLPSLCGGRDPLSVRRKR